MKTRRIGTVMAAACVVALAGCATEYQKVAAKKPASLTRSSTSYSTGSITTRTAPAPAREMSAEEKVRAERAEIKNWCAQRRRAYLLGMLTWSPMRR